jgi:single-stranded-DNA-specific exonuclease
VRDRLWTPPAVVPLAVVDGIRPEAVAIAQRRGIADLDAFFHPSLQTSMPDPLLLPRMDEAVAVFCGAIERGDAIAVLGDYDVDGATSVALLLRWLSSVGIDAAFYIPDRIKEGYGVNNAAVEQLHAQGTKLLVVVDSGTSAFAPLRRARELGLDVVVLDHHEPGPELPDALIVNPKLTAAGRPWDYLCSAGLVFLLLVAANRELDRRGFFAARAKPDLTPLLGLVAVATVADVVPLVGLNRAYVAVGLRHVASNPGMQALALAADKTEFDVRSIGYTFAPCINAALLQPVAEKLYRLNIGALVIEARSAGIVAQGARRVDGIAPVAVRRRAAPPFLCEVVGSLPEAQSDTMW